jgi:hypothetical protein
MGLPQIELAFDPSPCFIGQLAIAEGLVDVVEQQNDDLYLRGHESLSPA